MKRVNWQFWSLTLNVILLGTVFVLASRPSAMKTELKAAALPQTMTMVASRFPARLSVQSGTTNANDGNWRDWLLQLRAAGVPDKVLAGLVVSDFESRWQKQSREMQKRYDKGDLDEDAMARLDEQHDADQEEEVKDALGADGFLKWDKEKVLSDIDTNKIQLSSSETDALYQLRKDLAQKESDLKQAHLNGEIDETDYEAQEAAAEKESDEKTKSLLGDARYAALKTPEDGAQGELVRTLNTLNASGTQFEAMLAAQKQWNDSRSKLDSQLQDSQDQSKSYEEQMQAIDAARDAEYQRVLGTNGFDTLQKSQDGNYQTLQRYATAWQLSGDDVDYVYREMQYAQKSVQDYEQQAHDLEAQGQQVDWPKVEENVKEFTQQTQQGLRSYLGDDRFAKLQKNSVFESSQ